jgi:S-adenosyl methyltransferase
MLVAVLHFFADDDEPQGIVSTLVDALPRGSYLTISHLTADFVDPAQAAAGWRWANGAGSRTRRAPRRKSPPSSPALT